MTDTIESLKADLLASQERARLLLGSNESLVSALTIATQAEVEARKQLAASRLEVERLNVALEYIAYIGLDCPMMGDKESFYRSQLCNAISTAANARALSAPPSPDAFAAHDREVEEKVFRDTCDICAGIAQTLLRAGDPGEIEETIRRMAAEREAKP